MGCGTSSKPKKFTPEKDEETQPLAEDSPEVVDYPDPDSPGGNSDGPDISSLLEEIAHKVAGIREKAQDYHEYLLKKVVDIEQAAAVSSSAEPQSLRENGIILVPFGKDAGNAMLQENSMESAQESQFLQVDAGDKVEIVMRESGGWAYCRKQCSISGVAPEAPELGWVPSAGVAELAVLIADHEVTDGETRMLAAKRGDTVEVVSRHYSGWALCREWHGVPKEGEQPHREGWVTDAYLEDRRSAAALATKWHRLVLEALERVVTTAKQTETMLDGVQGQELKGDESMEWMGKCLEFTTMLAQELQYITQAVSQHDISASSHGSIARLQWDVPANSEHELGGSQGDRVVILNAEYNEWIWCSTSEGSKREGWVPRNVLIMEETEGTEAFDATMGSDDIELPSWIKEGQECRWHSKSRQCFYDVTIRSVNHEEHKIEVVFIIDSTCWKHVPFDHFLLPPEEWLLQPLDEKSKELRSQLPDWVKSGRVASWWSDSQQRCMSVHIQEVDCRKRMIYVNFDVDPNARKHVPFHQLIDDPDKCLLQSDKKKHAWRRKHPSKGSVDSTKSEDDAFQQAEGLRMSSLINDIVEDVGDMLGPDGAEQKSKTGGGISFSDRVKNEMLALPPSDLEAVSETKGSEDAALTSGKDVDGKETPKTKVPSWVAAGLADGATLEDSLITEHPLEASIGPRDGALGSSKAGALADRIAALAKAAAAPDSGEALETSDSQALGVEATGEMTLGSGQAMPSAAASQQASGAQSKELQGLSREQLDLPEGVPIADNYLGEGKEVATEPAFGGVAVADAIEEPTVDLLSRGEGLGTASAEHELTKKVAKVDVVDYSQSEEEADFLSDLRASTSETAAVGQRGQQLQSAATSGAEAATSGVEASEASLESISPGKVSRSAKSIDIAASQASPLRTLDGSSLAQELGGKPLGSSATPMDLDASLASVGEKSHVDSSSQDDAASKALPPVSATGGLPPVGGKSLSTSAPPEDMAAALARPGKKRAADGILNLNLGLDSDDSLDKGVPGRGFADSSDLAPSFGAAANLEPPHDLTETRDPFSAFSELDDIDEALVNPGTEAAKAGTHAQDGTAPARVRNAGKLQESEAARAAAGGGRGPSAEANVIQVRSAEDKGSFESTMRLDELGQTMGGGPAPWFNPEKETSPLNDTISPSEHGPSEYQPKPNFNETTKTVGSLASSDSDAASSALRTTAFGGAMAPRLDSDAPAPKQGWGTMQGFYPATGSHSADFGPSTDAGEHGGGGGGMGDTPLFRKRPMPGWGAEAEVEDDGEADAGVPLESLDPSAMAREALRLLDPETWDSEAEAGTRRAPDTKVLAKAWDRLEGPLDARLAADAKPFDVDLEEREKEAVHEIRRVAEEVQDTLEFKARGAMSTMNEEVAANHRARAWEVMQSADKTLSRRAEAKEARRGLRKRKRHCRKESVHRAVGDKPADVAGAWFVPDSQALMDLSSSGAVAEVSECAWEVLRAVEVVALRPTKRLGGKAAAKAWLQAAVDEAKTQRRDESGPLREACEAVAKSLSASLEALLARLARERDEAVQPDPSLEALAKGDEGLTKEQKRDKALFEGQQEFDWERKLSAKVKQSMRHADSASAAAIERVEKVLQRRWRRGYQRDRAQTLGAVAALARAVAEAEEALDRTWREHQEKAAHEAAELERERRRVHGQTRLLLSAALVIREEKDRMAKAYSAATVAQKQKLMRKSLKRVRRLNNELKSMEVLPELKQNHSVLLYSLRMLEARLSTEVPAANEVTVEEGSLEETLSSGGQLADIDRSFQEQLTADLSALESTHDGQARRTVAKMARGFVRAITEEHGKAVPIAREAIEMSIQAATLAELASLVMRPFATAAAGLMPEASRHSEVSQSKCEVSTFAPPIKRQMGAIKETLEAVESLRPALLQMPEMGPAACQAAAKYRDRDWEDAVNATEQQWRSFCDAHPLVAEEDDEASPRQGPQTPRGEEEIISPTTSSCASPNDAAAEGRAQLELRQALEVDDMEFQSQAGATATKFGKSANRPKTGRERAKAPLRPPPGSGPEAPKSPQRRRSEEQRKPGVPKAKRSGKAGDNKATALLAQLDELSQTMDTALAKSKKTAKASRPAGGPAPPAPLPPPKS